MLKFLVYQNDSPADDFVVRNAYLVGSDNNAIRADISFEDGMICCEKREPGAAALCIQIPVASCGELSIQTCLLPEHDEPYLLMLELARHRLMVLYNKLEDWGMFELEDEHPVTKRAELARQLFVEALCRAKEAPADANKKARDALVVALDGTEELALAHSESVIERRRSSSMLPRQAVGAAVRLDETNERVRTSLRANFDFVRLSTPWRLLAPEEGTDDLTSLDSWTQWAERHHMPILAGPLVCFEPACLPDWIYIWEHDFETLRDLIYEHIEQVVSRYKSVINSWIVVSGLHVNNHFTLNFEQIMDLTRMTAMLVKKTHPSAKVLVEIRQPFGEYYATNQRSIPPLMYADLVMQSAVQFDGFAIRYPMGQAVPGQYVRDLMQFSHMLDQYAPLGKPMHVGLTAPSQMVTAEMIAHADPQTGGPVDANCGYWRQEWSPQVQAHWMEAACQIALGKTFVESVSWHDLVDHPDIEMPLGGLVTEELQPKLAFRRLINFRKNFHQPPAAEDVGEPIEDTTTTVEVESSQANRDLNPTNDPPELTDGE